MVDENALAALVISDPEFEELERSQDVFCPFEAIGMVRQEIRHGHFLSYIFDAQRPHGFGTECLRALLKAIARSSDQLSDGLRPIDVHLMNVDNARVRREWKGIDILIDIPRGQSPLIIAIELKIDSHEHSGQLGRYRAVVEREWPNCTPIFPFLTKRGDEPSEEDGEGWVPVEMEALAEELEGVLRRASGAPEARELLGSYLSMLRRHHLSNERLEALAASLWAKHREALEYLVEQRPDAASDVFRQLFEEREAMAKEFSAISSLEIVPDHSSPSYVRFAIPAWDGIPGFLTAKRWTENGRVLLIELAKGGANTVRIRFQLGPGDMATRERIYTALKDDGADVGARGRLTHEWNRLASTTIVKLKDNDALDVEATVAAVKKAAVSFVAKHASAYNNALNKLIEPAPR